MLKLIIGVWRKLNVSLVRRAILKIAPQWESSENASVQLIIEVWRKSTVSLVRRAILKIAPQWRAQRTPVSS
jgi:ribosome recycling factor